MNSEDKLQFFKNQFEALRTEISRVYIGNGNIVENCLVALFSGGHVLLEGVPGVGKTLLVKSIARAFGLDFKRIQFTPDLMPSDITGTEVIREDVSGGRSFEFKPGPIFSNVVLADEINRATPKTQSALLEAMAEAQVSVLGETHKLTPPFFVLATQNPIELEGTYPLPEAQLDRFSMKLFIEAPTAIELNAILEQTTGSTEYIANKIILSENPAHTVVQMQKFVREVLVPKTVRETLIRMLLQVTPNSEYSSARANSYVRFGPGPRAAQSILLAAKVKALISGRVNVAIDDLKDVFLPCVRHRLILNFQSEVDGVNVTEVINSIL